MDMSRRGGAGGIPKLREILRRQRGDSESSDAPDIEFIYDDADDHEHELAELYSYTEDEEFQLNRQAFENHFSQYDEKNEKLGWRNVESGFQSNYLLNLLNDIERAESAPRLQLLRAILYLCQGVYGECSSVTDLLLSIRHNVFLLYESGFFVSMIEMLNLESDNSLAASTAQRKPAVSIADSSELRVILNVLYCIVEEMRVEREDDSEHRRSLRKTFASELAMPMFNNEPIAVLLFNMLSKFCNGTTPHFPIKKVLLLLWKVILVSMGTTKEHFSAKNRAREAAGLPAWPEDTIEVCKTIRASSPPATGYDFMDNNRGRSRISSKDAFDPFADTEEDEEKAPGDSATLDGVDGGTASVDGEPGTPRPGSPITHLPPPRRILPWAPKVRVKEIETFLETTRQKFVGFAVRDDIASLAGLPEPIHEAVETLQHHLYTSLADLQVKREEDITKHPLSRPEPDVTETPPETLYRAMLPNLPQYMISLLKLLLAAAPTSKAKAESINILADVLPEEMPTTVKDSMRLGIDVNRHKEIVVKSISAIFILLLKWFKLNHVYQGSKIGKQVYCGTVFQLELADGQLNSHQGALDAMRIFEFMSQHLVFANCIPLVIKFFNQNMLSYVQANNGIEAHDFPACLYRVETDEEELNTINMEETSGCCWRNLFSCINLLRILNKLTKWKHSRTMMLIIFKSAPILKRALKVKHAMMQVYILKLIKLQTKYLGRQWRKSNMKTMSAVYSKIRHRLTDDWAFGNDLDARPWDFQQEEYALRSCVDRFNNRRYINEGYDPDFKPANNNAQSVLGEDVPLTLQFKVDYERWLEREVHQRQTDWDLLLSC